MGKAIDSIGRVFFPAGRDTMRLSAGQIFTGAATMSEPMVEVTRGALVECRHRGDIAVMAGRRLA